MFEKHSLSSLTDRMTVAADSVWQAGKGYLTMVEPSWQKAVKVNPIHQTDTPQGQPLPSLLSTLQQGVTWLYHHPKQIMMLTGLALAYSTSRQEQRAHDNLSSQLEMNGEADFLSHQDWHTLIPSSTQMVSQMAVIFSVGSLLNHPERYTQEVFFLTPLNLMTISSFLPMMNAQITETEFLKIFGESSTDRGSALTTTSAGEIVVVGDTTSFGAGSSDVLVTKLFANGTLAWARTLGGSNSDLGFALTTTPTGEIVIVGETLSFGAGLYDVLVTKLLANGTLAWARTLGGSGNDRGYALITTSTGEVLLTGRTTSFGAGSSDVLVAKLFADGTLAWARTLGGSSIDYGYALTTTATGEIVVAGYTRSFGAGSNDVLVTKLFANGTLAWARTLGGSNSDDGFALITTSTGEVLLTGRTTSFGAGNNDILVAKLFANGTLAWARTLGRSNNDYGRALTTTSTGEIVVAGDTLGFGAGLEDVLVAKLDSNGTVPGCTHIRTIQPTVLSWSNISNTVIVPTLTLLSTTGGVPTRISIQDWTTISTQFITPQELFLCPAGNLSMSTQSGAATSTPTASSSPTDPTSNNPSGTSQSATSTSMAPPVSSRFGVTTNTPNSASTNTPATQTRGPILFSVSVSPTPIIIEQGVSTLLTTNHLSVSGNANPSQVVYTVQGNNPDVVITVNGTETTLFTQADVEGKFVEIALQGNGCQDYSNTVQLQASVAGSSSTVDVGLIFEGTTLSCNAATRTAGTAPLNIGLLLTASGLGFWAKERDKRQSEQPPQPKPSATDIQVRHK